MTKKESEIAEGIANLNEINRAYFMAILRSLSFAQNHSNCVINEVIHERKTQNEQDRQRVVNKIGNHTNPDRIRGGNAGPD